MCYYMLDLDTEQLTTATWYGKLQIYMFKNTQEDKNNQESKIGGFKKFKLNFLPTKNRKHTNGWKSM